MEPVEYVRSYCMAYLGLKALSDKCQTFKNILQD